MNRSPTCRSPEARDVSSEAGEARLARRALWRLGQDRIERLRRAGEDRRLVEPAWCTPSYDADTWTSVATSQRGYAELVASPAPPVRAVQEILRCITLTTSSTAMLPEAETEKSRPSASGR